MSATAMVRVSNLAAATNEELLQRLADGLRLTAEGLVEMALVWGELDRRGVDLSRFRSGVGRLVPLVAAGRLAPEAVVAFAGQPSILRALEGVPLARQKELAAGEPVEVLAGDKTARVGLAAIPASTLKNVFVNGRELRPEEQRVVLSRPKQPKREEKERRTYRVRYEPDTKSVRVGKMTVPLAEVMAAVAEALSPHRLPPVADSDLGHAEGEVVRLWPHEVERLAESARKTGFPKQELIRQALQAWGVI